MESEEINKLLAEFKTELDKSLEVWKGAVAGPTNKKASKKAEKAKLEKYKRIQQSKGKELLRGIGGAAGLAVGAVRVIDDDPEKKAQIEEGEIYVADYPTWGSKYLKKAAAIVTNTGGRTSFAAIFGREYGIPTVVGTFMAMEVLQDGQKVVVDGNAETDEKGRWVGIVYEYDDAKLEKYEKIQQLKGKVLLRGRTGAVGLAVGAVRVVDNDPEKKAQLKRGEVYVGRKCVPEDYPHLKKAAAIVTDSRRRSTVARAGNEWGIPAVVDTHAATKVLKNGQKVVVDGSEGIVYACRRKPSAKHEEQ